MSTFLKISIPSESTKSFNWNLKTETLFPLIKKKKWIDLLILKHISPYLNLSWLLNKYHTSWNFHENRFITDLKDKTELFNSFFEWNVQFGCSEIPPFIHPKTDKSLSKMKFIDKDIKKVISRFTWSTWARFNQDSMINIFGKTMIMPLETIYKKCLE